MSIKFRRRIYQAIDKQVVFVNSQQIANRAGLFEAGRILIQKIGLGSFPRQAKRPGSALATEKRSLPPDGRIAAPFIGLVVADRHRMQQYALYRAYGLPILGG